MIHIRKSLLVYRMVFKLQRACLTEKGQHTTGCEDVKTNRYADAQEPFGLLLQYSYETLDYESFTGWGV